LSILVCVCMTPNGSLSSYYFKVKENLIFEFLPVSVPEYSNRRLRFLDSLTARQYGEVVLPNASTGQGPGTLRQRGQKAVTMQDFNCGQMRALTAVAFFDHRNEVTVVAKAGVRVQEPLQICLECSIIAKSVANNLPIVRMVSCLFFHPCIYYFVFRVPTTIPNY